MILTLIFIGLAFIWLGYETDWMTVRLLVGAHTPVIEQPKRKWQFLKYGEDALLLCQQCRNVCPNHHRYNEDRWFGWAIPARTVKVFGSTMNFKEGCNYQRANLLKEIAKAQKSMVPPKYKHTGYVSGLAYSRDCGGEIELLVDGKPILATGNGNGDYKRGVIKEALKPYTTKLKTGRHTFICAFGEADRIAP